MKQRRRFWTTVIGAIGTSLLCHGAGFVRVAYDDAGADDARQPHLAAAEGPWRFDVPGTSDEALRTVVFGKRIEFVYRGMDPRATYKTKLRFFSDGKRESCIRIANVTATETVFLEKGNVVEREIEIPPAAYATGTLVVTIERVGGSNAIVSDIEILSTTPGTLEATFVPDVNEPLSLPRLSPRPVRVGGVSVGAVDLAGAWQFNPAPSAEFWRDSAASAKAAPGWVPIQVPGEWVMQGFAVKPGMAAGYRRTFAIPRDWAGTRVKLRCEGVYSKADVWINGKRAGHHEGGFTPFELDVTEWVDAATENVVALAVTNESDADRMASGSQYACHALGGISRGIRLFALPIVNVASLAVTTAFDAAFRDATLTIALGVANEGDAALAGAKAVLSLAAPDGKLVPLAPNVIEVGALDTGQTATNAVSIRVDHPLKWDNEHPHLYTLTVGFELGGKVLETLVQRVGFRQIEIRGNRMFVNNRPVKLRGVNHHETYPLTGRSVPAGLDRRDVELFREANVNLLRTCHYPPNEALMEAADELGMFIECEAPFCWTPVPFVRTLEARRQQHLILLQTAETVLTYRNHPSVLYWSLANESRWGEHFAASSELVRQIDPSRPQTFNNPGDTNYTEIVNLHYSGHGGPAQARTNSYNPIYLGEDCHLNAYNRLELATDPALRDMWGRYLREMWDDIYDSDGCLGQSIWAGIDDTFYLKDDQTVGYGTWGPIDGWRRPKPEYWGMKKAYSPVRVLNGDSLTVSNGIIEVVVQNRQNFSDLGEMRIRWKTGNQSGTLAPRLAPEAKGTLRIALKGAPGAGEHLELEFDDPRGFLADRFCLPLIHGRKPAAVNVGNDAPACTIAETADTITITGGTFAWTIRKSDGQFAEVVAGSAHLPLGGPILMLLPLNNTGDNQMHGVTKVWTPFTDPCAGWTCGKVQASTDNNRARVSVSGAYTGAKGTYTMTFDSAGRVDVAYAFTVTQTVNPRQIGLVFSLPRACEVSAWERKGYWGVYPEDHIARLKGTVRASEGFEATSVGPRKPPAHPWRLDNLPYGNNDFCSTKHNVIRATLTDAEGRGLAVDGGAVQHVRCWRTDVSTFILVADYSNGGSERFLSKFTKGEERPLKSGDPVKGVTHLAVLPQK